MCPRFHFTLVSSRDFVCRHVTSTNTDTRQPLPSPSCGGWWVNASPLRGFLSLETSLRVSGGWPHLPLFPAVCLVWRCVRLRLWGSFHHGRPPPTRSPHRPRYHPSAHNSTPCVSPMLFVAALRTRRESVAIFARWPAHTCRSRALFITTPTSLQTSCAHLHCRSRSHKCGVRCHSTPIRQCYLCLCVHHINHDARCVCRHVSVRSLVSH
jgi:hypothetical protein